ncbi:MAG: rare lipoprotein A [Parcubacteria group bacterium Gr01-1014_70]|nr:MAG: rare lipoprotein A [Parcubacteria group bacterium Gr01-1014_70]
MRSLEGASELAGMSKKQVFARFFAAYAEGTAERLTKGLAAGFFTASSLFPSFMGLANVEAGGDINNLVKEITSVISAVEERRDYPPKGLGEHYQVTGEIQYVVRDGDTVYSITKEMKRNGIWVKPQQIIEWNDLSPPHYYLKPGTKLTLYDLRWEPQLVEASWYGPGFHGRLMANSQSFDENSLVAAHMHLPLGMRVRVTNMENGISIEVPITDRGNFEKYQRGIDLSKQAAKILGYHNAGTAKVLIEPLQSF